MVIACWLGFVIHVEFGVICHFWDGGRRFGMDEW